MKYSKDEVMQYVIEEDVKFIRIAFCDIFGKQKNISIMPHELERAFKDGIAFDASAVEGFEGEEKSDLFLHPDPTTLSILPWRPEHGRVVRMFASVTYPDGTPYPSDTRTLLKEAVRYAESKGLYFSFGAEEEFYLFKLDENGEVTDTPYDNAGCMDIAPEDKGENVRREICLTLEQMGIKPERSHHEEGPGQNEIDFRYSDPLTTADNAMTFQTVVKTVAGRNGLYADFSAKPIIHYPGNGFHINMSVKSDDGEDKLLYVVSGMMKYVRDMTLFLNPTQNSYLRFGQDKAPIYITWSRENRSQLVRVPAAFGEYCRAELRSPDPTTNPYIAFALLIYAAVESVQERRNPPEPVNLNLYKTNPSYLTGYEKLPLSLEEAIDAARSSEFIRKHIPKAILDGYCSR